VPYANTEDSQIVRPLRIADGAAERFGGLLDLLVAELGRLRLGKLAGAFAMEAENEAAGGIARTAELELVAVSPDALARPL
jgi:hypothetical protein